MWDDLSPFGKTSGLTMTGRVRNWARLVKGKVTFDRQAKLVVSFAPDKLDPELIRVRAELAAIEG